MLDQGGPLKELGGLGVGREGDQLLGQGVAGLGRGRQLPPSGRPGEELLPGGLGVERLFGRQGGEVALLQEHTRQPPERGPLTPPPHRLQGNPEVEGLEEVEVTYERTLGFVPNGLRIMARRPEMDEADTFLLFMDALEAADE